MKKIIFSRPSLILAAVVAIIIIIFTLISRHSTSLPYSPIPTISTTPTASPISIDTSLPNPRVLRMDGSTSMVKLMKLLRNEYARIYPSIATTYGTNNSDSVLEEKYTPKGSDVGLEKLLKGEVEIAASSRVLKPKEAEAGVQLFAIAHDAVAIVVGVDNPFKKGLTKEQLRSIYQGRVKNWSELGVSRDVPIRVYNRAKESGTQKSFQDIVLLGEKFYPDDQAYFKTWPTDETTAVLRELKSDGIYYATVSQAIKEETVRVVPIDGVDPKDPQTILSKAYPIVRDLYLAIPQKTSPAVKKFVDFALSEDGQKLVKEADFVPIR